MSVYIKKEFERHELDIKALKESMQSVLENLGCGEKELSILLVNDERICKLNAQYRKISQATDVLSFPQNEFGVEFFKSPLLGDVVVSIERAWHQAKIHRLSFEEEIVLLLIHGILHLLGFDHQNSHEEAQEMKQKTHSLFKSIFPNTVLAEVEDY